MAPRSTLSKLALVCLASSVVPSTSALTVAISAAQALGVLQGRQTSTCPISSYSRCADPKLPSDFCCPRESTCISLDSSSTALCCPKGADCTKIQPVSCDLNFQDVSAVPDAAIKTTRLGDKAVSCGSNTCCPFGYSCDNNQCILDKATSSAATSSPSSASSTSTPDAVTTSPAGIDSDKPAPAGSATMCPRFPGAAVAVGFFPGMLAGALLALITIICLGRRHPQNERPFSKGSGWSSHKYSSSVTRGGPGGGAITGISQPIPLTQGARTDFLRRQPSVMLRSGASRAKSWFSARSSPTFGTEREKNSPLNPINHWKMPTPPIPNNIPLKSMGKAAPVTPPSQIRPSAASLAREPSTESIKVYSPPSMVRPPSKSGFSPPSAQASLKHSIMEKLSPKFRGTELKPKVSALSIPVMNATDDYHGGVGRVGGGALDPYPAYANTSALPSPPYPSHHHHHHLSNNPPSHHPPSSYQTAPPPPPPQAPFASNNPRHLTHMTTFTDVLRDAGLESSEPVPVPVPAMPRALDWKAAKKNGGNKWKMGGREGSVKRGNNGGGGWDGGGAAFI